MTDEDPTGYDALVAAIRDLPPNTEIRWTQHHQDYFGVLTSYVDVYAPSVCDPAGLSWGWTVELPADEERDYVDHTEINAQPTWQVVMAWDATDGFTAHESLRGLFAVEWRNDCALVIPAEHSGAIEALPDEWTIDIDGGWMPDDISRIVQDWITEHTGRTDLTLVYDTSIEDPMTAALQERIDSMKDGETVQIGDGVFAHPEVMDQLLAMEPDEAAAVTKAMQEVRDA